MTTHIMIIAGLLILILFLITFNGDFLQLWDGALQGAYINILEDNDIRCSVLATYVSGLKRFKLSLMLLTTTADVNNLNKEPRSRMGKLEDGRCRNKGLWKRCVALSVSKPRPTGGAYFTQRGPPRGCYGQKQIEKSSVDKEARPLNVSRRLRAGSGSG